jgi:hypothetical protein
MTTARARAYAARREVSDWVMRKMSPVLTPPWRIVGLVSILGGLAVFVSWHPSTWVGLDLARIAAAGAEWHAGRDPYAVGGFLYAPPMAVVGALLTPTFGVRSRRWWIALGGFVALSAAFGPMWLDWLQALLNSDGSIVYFVQEWPILTLPLAALAGNRWRLAGVG